MNHCLDWTNPESIAVSPHRRIKVLDWIPNPKVPQYQLQQPSLNYLKMEKIKHELEVHGNAVQAGANLAIKPKDECASITLNHGERQLRFPFPTPTIVDGHRLKAGKFFIRFTTYDSARIYFVRIMDGDKELVLQQDLNWRGTSTNASFVFPGAPIEVQWGLNITVGVDSDSAPAKIDIIGLGIVFY